MSVNLRRAMVLVAVLGLALASYLVYVHYSGTPPACTAAAEQPPAFMPPSAIAPALPTPTPDDAPDPPAFIPPEVARAAHAHLSNG